MPISTPTPSGDRVRALRGRQGLSQAELAKKADISPTTVATMETGARNVRPATVRRIARALGVSPGELFDPDPKARKPRLSAWEVAVGEARRLREDGRERMGGLLTAWRGAEAGGDERAAREHLDAIGGLLDEVHKAEKVLRSAGADGKPGAPETDDYIYELQEASRFYGELVGLALGEGLGVKRTRDGIQVEALAA